MRKKRFASMYMLAAIGCAIITSAQMIGETRSAPNRVNNAKKLFLRANVALSEGRFADAYRLSRKLISNYPAHPHIWLFTSVYVHSFYFLDEDFQKGMLRPTPPGIQKRIEALKAKSNKSVIDLVTLARVADYESGGFSTEYLKEILQKFPDSVWADWAKLELGFENIPGKGTTTKERYAAFYNLGMNFMKSHPHTHLMPRLLCITANSRRRMSEDKLAKDEAIRMYQRVLDDYPNVEYYCASARRDLREFLGEGYQDPPGCSEDRDRTITLFYCQRPQPGEYKKRTKEYILMIEELEGETESFPVLSYVLITLVVTVAIAGGILLHKKKTVL